MTARVIKIDYQCKTRKPFRMLTILAARVTNINIGKTTITKILQSLATTYAENDFKNLMLYSGGQNIKKKKYQKRQHLSRLIFSC